VEDTNILTADHSSPFFKGNQSATNFPITNLNSLATCYWRVDELDATNGVTKGEVWRFRTRHLAFPGAEGYGRFARGGRGGRVIEVNHLNDGGPGSLRAAVEAEGPRTVVFNVSGLITLESKLQLRNPYITVAGQTAPGKGICVRKFNFGLLGAKDAIVRHVRVRPGNIASITLDGMGMASSDHCIFDHCSISWSIDEAFSSRSAKNITLQRTLISEALNEAGHTNYPPGTQHGYAASISGSIGSFHHNLLAHCAGRNWSLAGGLNNGGKFDGYLDIRNNVVFNWKDRTTDGGAKAVNYEANCYTPGPATTLFKLARPDGGSPTDRQQYFITNNVLEGYYVETNNWSGVQPQGGATEADIRVNTPFFPDYVTNHTARDAFKRVLSDTGCNQPGLDDHDARVIQETLGRTYTYSGSKTGLPGLPDTQDDVGGWENYPHLERPADWDTDHDGLPDWWETLHGLNPGSPPDDFSDSNADPDGDGYTQLEDYLNWLAAPHVACDTDAPVDVDLSRFTRGFTNAPIHAVSNPTHGTITLLADGKTARFTPAPGFSGLGSFDLAVTDAESSTMTVTMGVRVRPPAPPRLGLRESGAALDLAFEGASGHVYVIQSAPQLPDWTDWTNLPGAEAITWVPIPFFSGETQRFFRARLEP
jgi:hypothetical protein